VKKFKGRFYFDGKYYNCEVIDGIRYIEGKTVDEFMGTVTDEQNARIARVGKMAIEDEIKAINPPKGKYEYYANE
jgi:hypothetical protein